LRVREALAIGEKRQLLIVQCGEKQLLIGAAGNCLTMLAELAPSDKHDGETI
jgi:flagellar biogenesis protein FliO